MQIVAKCFLNDIITQPNHKCFNVQIEVRKNLISICKTFSVGLIFGGFVFDNAGVGLVFGAGLGIAFGSFDRTK
jgi:hypothetical protein